jgi:hypothetical protein
VGEQACPEFGVCYGSPNMVSQYLCRSTTHGETLYALPRLVAVNIDARRNRRLASIARVHFERRIFDLSMGKI